MACVWPWTTRDEYGVYLDCHVWSPFYTIIGVLVVILGGINTLFGVQRLSDKTNRTIGIFLTLHSVLLMLVYIVRLSTGLVLGDKNVALNFFHGLSLGCLWGGVNAVILSYLEVVLLTEKLRGKTGSILQRARGGFLVATILFILVTVICFTVPCFAPHMSLPHAYWSFLAAAASIDSAIFWYYGWGLRKILTSMEYNQTFYAGLVKKLDIFLLPMFIAPWSTIGSCILFLTVPVFFQNMYILVGMMMLMSQGVTTLVLLTKSSSTSGGTAVKPERGSKSGSHAASTKGSSGKDATSVHLNLQQQSSQGPSRDSSRPASPDQLQSIVELETKQVLKNIYAKGSARIEEMETNDPEPSLGGSTRVYPEKKESELNLDLSSSRSHEPLLVSSTGVSPTV